MLEILIAKAGIASGGGIVITEDVLKAIAAHEPERYIYDDATGALYLNLKVAIQMATGVATFRTNAGSYEMQPH